MLAEKDGPKVWERCEEVGERSRGCYGYKRYVVDFEGREEPANANTVWLMPVSYYNNLCITT